MNPRNDERLLLEQEAQTAGCSVEEYCRRWNEGVRKLDRDRGKGATGSDYRLVGGRVYVDSTRGTVEAFPPKKDTFL